MIISFVRGLEEQNLITSSVSFEEEIDLQNYIEKDLFDNNLGTKYKLYAINVRVGYTKSSGHCYSYVKVKNEWICFNDTRGYKSNPSFNLNSVEIETNKKVSDLKAKIESLFKIKLKNKLMIPKKTTQI